MRLRLLAAFAAIYLIWGSTFLAIRLAVETQPPLLMMAVRHLGAGALLAAWLAMRGEWKPERRLWAPAFFCGAFCFLGGHGLLAWAELYVPSGLAALLAATLPIWMVLLARARGQGSEITVKVMCGIAMGLAGVALLVPFRFGGGQREGLAALAILLGEILWAVGAIHARAVKSAFTFTAMQMLCGGVLLLVAGLTLGEGAQITAASFSLRAVASLLFLMIFGSLVAFTAYCWLLKVSTPAIVSTHSYVNPLVAVLLGWALVGETVTPRTILGAAIVLASVALVSVKKR